MDNILTEAVIQTDPIDRQDVPIDSNHPVLQKIAKLAGEPLILPEDLYIPPEALEVFLEIFEGPLDLLLYLIQKQNLDILDIPVAKIAAQYMVYVDLMSAIRFDLAAEYLEMAAYLIEIKSRLLLPKLSDSDHAESDLENDPRAALVRRLQEYEQFRNAATRLDLLPRWERDIFPLHVGLPDFKTIRPLPAVELSEVVRALQVALLRSDAQSAHKITREGLSVRARMSDLLEQLMSVGGSEQPFILLTRFFDPGLGRLGLIVTFLAILELLKTNIIEMTQSDCFEPIYIRMTADTRQECVI